MTALSPTAPLLLLLASVAATAQPAPEDWDTAGVRHVELTADTAGQEADVRISPHRTTNLVFHTPLQPGGVVVENEHLVAVAVNEARGMVTLLPSRAMQVGERLRMAVRFADGKAPESVTFWLVVHPRAEAQVEVYRRTRSAESYQQEARQEHARAERCEAELERTRAEQKHPGGLAGLFDAGLVGKGGGIQARDLTSSVTQRPGETLQVSQAFSYRTMQGGRVAVELVVWNKSTQPWKVGEAELLSTEGERLRVVRIWPPEPIPPGMRRRLVVEAEAMEAQSRGSFFLKLGEEGGPRTITVRGVTFS